MTKRSPFKYFKSSPEIIRLAVMIYVRYPLSLRNVEDLLHKRGIDICHETVRFCWHRFGPMFAVERSGEGTQNLGPLQINDLRPREGSTAVPFPPPLALTKAFSRSG